MNVLMELTDMIFIHFCELLLMFVSCVYNLFFNGHMELAPIFIHMCEEDFLMARFICL